MIKSESIRNAFLNFFEKQNHTLVESSPVVPENDPSLLFTNAGMVQFKEWFTGEQSPKYKNVVSSQKCIRAGGKHNDLDNVGYTPRHHTFFEMLGNFSFGSYFKEQAIYLAWEFLIRELKLKKEKIFISVYNKDEESEKLWKKISGFSQSKIIKISSSDNFWSMGDSGPCGPCSEIFYDQGSNLPGGLPGSKNQDGPRFIEIWNLVFMEFNRKNNRLLKLPKKCVDTGMGLERITAVINGKKNNFEIDIFENIIKKISELTNTTVSKNNIHLFRIIADHIRSIVFIVSEGLIPSNEGRGYVVRRIIRRAAKQMNSLNFHKPLLHDLVKLICNLYAETFFELTNAEEFIKNTVYEEEKKFLLTLNEGNKLLEKEIENCSDKTFPAEVIFKLYDTFGFPIDMTEQLLLRKNFVIDKKNLNKLFDYQKKLSKRTWTGSGDVKEDKFLSNLMKYCELTKFVGYEKLFLKSKLIKIVKDNNFLDEIKENINCILIFEKTPFFAESGGQIGDSGYIKDNEDKIVFEINDTKKNKEGIYLHYGKVMSDEGLDRGKIYNLVVDKNRRKRITNNHTSTHILHESLRKVIGEHVSQKGSLVTDEKLRFDFTCNSPISKNQIEKIENIVNNIIRENLEISTSMLPLKEALSSGAIGLFGEKYPEMVRVVTIEKKQKFQHGDFVSSELCGGTHVNFTGQIGSFKIVNQSAVSSGVRRLEALTGEKLNQYFNESLRIINQIKTSLRVNEEGIIQKIEDLRNENRLLKVNKEKNFNEFGIDKKNYKDLGKYKFYWQLISISPRELKPFADKLKSELDPDIFVIASDYESKVSLLVGVKDSLIKSFNAIELLNSILPLIGGRGGGGKNTLAQGGGNDNSRLDEIPQEIKKLIQ